MKLIFSYIEVEISSSTSVICQLQMDVHTVSLCLVPIRNRNSTINPYLVSMGTIGCEQGCQMTYFLTKNPNVGKLWRVLHWKMLVYLIAIWSILLTVIWYILWPFGMFYGHLVCFMAIWYILWLFGMYIFSLFGMLYIEICF
jgi:hypothetical protein